MTEVPTCPGVAEYLYQAARPALVRSDGTCIVPSALVPRRSSFEVTPMAGMRTDTGTDLRSEGPRPAAGPVLPATAADGCGACRWAPAAKPTREIPAASSSAPATPAARARGMAVAVGGGAYPSRGQDPTTRNPAMRRHSASCTGAGPLAGAATRIIPRHAAIDSGCGAGRRDGRGSRPARRVPDKGAYG